MGCIHGLENWQIWKQQSQSWNAGGVRHHFNVEPWSAFVEIHWGSGLEAYVTPVSETSINVCLLWDAKRYKPEHGGKKLFCSMLNEFPELQDRLKNADVLDESVAKGPLYQKTLGVANEKILLIGDAAGFFDPLLAKVSVLRAGTFVRKICRAGIEREFWKSCKGNV